MTNEKKIEDLAEIEGLEFIVYGAADVETRQFAPSFEYPDSVYHRGPYPGWMGLE